MTKEIKRIAYASTYTHQCNMVELLEHHTFESVIFLLGQIILMAMY
ncbi:hypothetical protein [Piscirickettsia salmonis]|nr:hypothetical protein [Piscirickettsia salmonis]